MIYGCGGERGIRKYYASHTGWLYLHIWSDVWVSPLHATFWVETNKLAVKDVAIE